MAASDSLHILSRWLDRVGPRFDRGVDSNVDFDYLYGEKTDLCRVDSMGRMVVDEEVDEVRV